MARIWSNRSPHARLDDVLEVDDAEHRAALRRVALGHHQRGAAGGGDPGHDLVQAVGRSLAQPRHHRAAGALADLPGAWPSTAARSTPDIRVWAVNSTKIAPLGRSSSSAPCARARATMDRPSGVWSARLDHRAASRSRSASTPGERQELGGLPVAEGDGAGLVQQQGADVPGRLDRPAGHGEHVAAHQPVHAGDADRAEQGADGGRDQADQQRDQDHQRLRLARRTRPSGPGWPRPAGR